VACLYNCAPKDVEGDRESWQFAHGEDRAEGGYVYVLLSLSSGWTKELSNHYVPVKYKIIAIFKCNSIKFIFAYNI